MEFAELTGLRANPSKSTVFYSGISLRTMEMLLDCLGMKEGKLRVRYLECPLISSKLSSLDCEALLENILSRINYWMV
jgi:hypothetical protein